MRKRLGEVDVVGDSEQAGNVEASRGSESDRSHGTELVPDEPDLEVAGSGPALPALCFRPRQAHVISNDLRRRAPYVCDGL
jgi:hypothetical protein